MRDFTWTAYRGLLAAAIGGGYAFHTFRAFAAEPEAGRRIVLRHDVDARPGNAVRMAEIEQEAGAVGTYFFRTVPATFDPAAIRAVYGLGHEVGYHYEDLAAAGGDPERALRSFERNLARLREIVPVATLCMHGSPLSRWDNRDLWRGRDYRAYGLEAEPYLDVDFSRVAYLTDTGRRWDGDAVSIRDRAGPAAGHGCRITADVARSLAAGALGDQVMLTLHPQRWDDRLVPWMGELVAQRAKNQGKRLLRRVRAGAAG